MRKKIEILTMIEEFWVEITPPLLDIECSSRLRVLLETVGMLWRKIEESDEHANIDNMVIFAAAAMEMATEELIRCLKAAENLT